MLNQNFMRALAKLESVSATEREKAIINSVRGLYVDRYGRDNQFVSTLAQLESVAATSREKAEINTIRGKFGLMEMTTVAPAFDDGGDEGDYSNMGVDSQMYKKRRKEMSTSADTDVALLNDPDTGLPMTDEMVDEQYDSALAAQRAADMASPYQDVLHDISLGAEPTDDSSSDWSYLFNN